MPESSAHCSTRASRAAVSRRVRALSGATSITAWLMAARQGAGGDPPGPVQHLLLRRAGFVRIKQGGGSGDDPRLDGGDDPVPQGSPGAGQLAVQRLGHGGQPVRGPPGLGQH